jgi:hypothetical protein
MPSTCRSELHDLWLGAELQNHRWGHSRSEMLRQSIQPALLAIAETTRGHDVSCPTETNANAARLGRRALPKRRPVL